MVIKLHSKMNMSRLLKLGFGSSTRLYYLPTYQYKREFFLRNSLVNTSEMQLRTISTVETKGIQKDMGLIQKILNKVTFFNVNKTKIMAHGYFLYEGVADKINYIDFFDELELPDTFYSWFVITELHIWMISVRSMAEDNDGKLLRNSMVEALWKDVSQRVKKLGANNPSIATLQVAELSEQLQAALIAYDEGLQSDDTVLAGALWRRFYQQQNVNLKCLDILVRYIRKQIRLLDNLSKQQLLENKIMYWDSLKK